MITHIVLFRASDRSLADELESEVAALGALAGVSRFSVQRDIGLHTRAYDVALITEHTDDRALAQFRADPAHHAAVTRINHLSDSRASIDLVGSAVIGS